LAKGFAKGRLLRVRQKEDTENTSYCVKGFGSGVQCFNVSEMELSLGKAERQCFGWSKRKKVRCQVDPNERRAASTTFAAGIAEALVPARVNDSETGVHGI
jgi:hypothetical protein